MRKALRSGAARSQVYILKTPLPQSTWILQTSYVMKSSRMCKVKLEVFRDPGVSSLSGEWTDFDGDVSRIFFVPTRCYLIGIDIAHRGQMIPTVTAKIS